LNIIKTYYYGNRTIFRSKAHKKNYKYKNKKNLCGKDSKRKRNVNETQFFELSNEDHGILENVK